MGMIGCAVEDSAQKRSTLETDCGSYETTFQTPGGRVLGTMSVTNDGTKIVIEIGSSVAGYFVRDVYLDVAFGPITAGSGGYINQYNFPFQEHFEPILPATVTIEIPLTDPRLAGVTCGSTLKVAAYAVFKTQDLTTALKGWVDGPVDCPFNSDDCTWFVYDLCECPEEPTPDAGIPDGGIPDAGSPDAGTPPPPPEQGCTRTQGYWKTHSKYAKNISQRRSWPDPVDEDDLLCGKTLLNIFRMESKGNAWVIVAHQYIAAILNVASGASATEGVTAAIRDAREFLLANCGGVPASEAATVLALKDVLDSYNNGVIGPGHCD